MTQTNAQRLADVLDRYATGDEFQRPTEEAVAELRRLDAIEKRHNEMLAHPCSEWDHKAYQQAIANLRAENAQLRAELEAVRRDADLEPALEALVNRCNNDAGMSSTDEVIAAEAALERLYKSRQRIDAAQAERAKGGE